ncbi:MAG: hypothetical protein RL329_2916 [Bacteroidota bacterium]|jgi:hypothetical protein
MVIPFGGFETLQTVIIRNKFIAFGGFQTLQTVIIRNELAGNYCRLLNFALIFFLNF